MSRRVAIVYYDGGTAHRTTAFALREALARANGRREVCAIDLLDVFGHHRPSHWALSGGLRWFNDALRAESVRGLPLLLPLGRLFHDLTLRRGSRRMRRYWQPAPPDALVSTIPLFNEILFRSALIDRPATSCITVPVDFEEPTSRYWFTTRVEQHYLCATEGLVRQARAAGVPPDRIHRLPGFIVHPRFYEEDPESAASRLARLNLPADRPLGIVSFGGQGSNQMIEIGRRLGETDARFGVLFICGRNARARSALERLETPYPKAVLGYVEDVHRYLRLASFFVGKAGPVSIHEAVVCKVALVLIRSRGMAYLLGPNERWVREQELGVVIRDLSELAPAVREVLGSDVYRRAAERHAHRAVLEAVKIIDSIVGGDRAGA